MASRAAARVDAAASDRHRARPAGHDRVFVPLAAAHAAALLLAPSVPLIAIGLWWNANTIAHNFIHRPFFRSRAANRTFSACLSLVLGIPQSLWRQRHLRHHAELTTPGVDTGSRLPVSTPGVLAAIAVEASLVVAMWIVIAALAPRVFLLTYLPGWALGLTLCHLQGHFEHERGTTSHYGRVYNWLFFNDGYHVEHHRRPGTSWRELPALAHAGASGSRWPAVLRWLDRAGLEALERLVLRSPALQRFVLDRHERAFQTLLPRLGPIARVAIVGGGLFPRTALILSRLLPHTTITILDASAENLETARRLLAGEIALVETTYVPGMAIDADLVIVPLAYHGDRRRLYLEPPAAKVIVHDWIWSRRGESARVSWLLFKRLNLIRR